MHTPFFLDLLFPPRCVHCSKHLGRRVGEKDAAQSVRWNEVLCNSCFLSVRTHETLFCGKCRARLPLNKKICHYEHPYLLGAVGKYSDEVLKNLIHALKFNSVKKAAEPLGALLTEYVKKLDLPLAKYTVIPIPLPRERERVRGFNQAESIARYCAEHFHLPLETALLRRVRNVPPQSTLKNFEMRHKNIRNSFEISRGASSPTHVLLIDDVTTSGATLLEATRALKRGGAKKVIALTVASA